MNGDGKFACEPVPDSLAVEEDVMHMKRIADGLFDDNYRWSVLGAGRAQMPVATIAAAIGGNVRVGLEDSLWIGAGLLAASNADQVTQVRKIIEGHVVCANRGPIPGQ
jgi:uncharacterized protein (DUF849 family)